MKKNNSKLIPASILMLFLCASISIVTTTVVTAQDTYIGTGLYQDQVLTYHGNVFIVDGANVEYRNCMVFVEGSVTINATASLTLTNSTIQLNQTMNGEYHVLANSGSTFHILDGDNDPNTADGSMIMTDGSDMFNIIIDPNVDFQMKNSGIKFAGYNAGNTGLMISADNTIIENSLFRYCWAGIAFYSSSGNSVSGCNFTQNSKGIYLSDSDDNNIELSEFSYNLGNAIQLQNSDLNTFWQNFIDHNNDGALALAGIYVWGDSNNNTFNYNTLIRTQYGTEGIELGVATADNTITNNYISNWGPVLDDGTNNSWSNNMYNHYNGIDTDGNFVGETNYTIPGSSGWNDTSPRTRVVHSGPSGWTFANLQTTVDNVPNQVTIRAVAQVPDVGTLRPHIGYYPEVVLIADFTDIQIVGDGRNWVFVDGGGIGSTFHIVDSDSVYFESMTITGGNAAGIFLESRGINLVIDDVVLVDNMYGIYDDEDPYLSVDIISSDIVDNGEDGIYGEYVESLDRIISPWGPTADQPDIAIDSLGNSHIVYAEDGDDIWYMMLDLNGTVLIDGTSITPNDGGKARVPCLAIDLSNDVYVMWKDSSSGNQEVWYARLRPSLDDQDGDAASIAAIDIVPYMQLTNLGDSVQDVHFDIDSNNDMHVFGYEGGQFGNVHDFFYGKYDNNGIQLIAPSYFNLNPGASDIERNGLPNVKVDTNDNVHLCWNDYPSDGETSIYYSMMDNNGDWLIYPTILTGQGFKSGNQSMDLDQNYNVHIVWQDKLTIDSEIFYMKLDPYLDDMDGGPALPSQIVLIDHQRLTSDDGDKSNQPAIAVGPTGNVHVVWREENEYDLWYMKMDNNGNEMERWPFVIGNVTYSSDNWRTHWWLEVDSTDTPRMAWCDDSGSGYQIAYYSPINPTGTVTYNIVDSTISDNVGTGLNLDYNNIEMDSITVNIDNTNIDENNGRGFRLNVDGKGFADVDIVDSSISDNLDYGFFIPWPDHIDLDLNMFNSVFNGNGGNGFSLNGQDNLDMDVMVDLCEFSYNNGDGFHTGDQDFGSMIYSITNSEFMYNTDDGIEIGDHEDGTITDVADITISNNLVLYNGDDGIDVDGNYESDSDFHCLVSGNDVIGNGGDGIQFDEFDDSYDGTSTGLRNENIYLTVINNNVLYNAYDGIELDDSEHCTIYLLIQDCTINHNGDDGIEIDDADHGAVFYVDIIRVESSYNEGGGYYYDESDGYGSRMWLNMIDSQFINNEGYSDANVHLGESDDGTINAILRNVVIDGTTADYGLETDYSDYQPTYVEIYDSYIFGTENGIYMDMSYESSTQIWIYNSTIDGLENDICMDEDDYFHVWATNCQVDTVFTDEVGSDSEEDKYSINTFYKRWFYHIQVYTGPNLDQPAPGVTVTITEEESMLVGGMEAYASSGSFETDANGQIKWLIGTEYLFSAVVYQDFTTTFTTSNGMNTVSVNADIDTNEMWVTILLPGDNDADGWNDEVDPDDDNDGHPDSVDDFPYDPTEWLDIDGDGIGDNTDPDIDGDGHPNANDTFPIDPTEWIDTDNDTMGDNEDMDDDGDGWLDTIEIEIGTDPLDETSMPPDMDDDGIADRHDDDIDGDGVFNLNDAFPYDGGETKDTDGDGTGDNADTDDDGDGVPDADDEFPTNPDEWSDLDDDGIGDSRDNDIDGDGVMNDNDDFAYDSTEWNDFDGDGTGDNADTDADGDGIDNDADDFPMNPDDWTDTDNDGIGDNRDWDIDGDVAANARDAFPHDSTEWLDTDGDAVGNNEDTDDDGDGIPDTRDKAPLHYNEEVPSREETDLGLYILLVVMIILTILMLLSLQQISKKVARERETPIREEKPLEEKMVEEEVEEEVEPEVEPEEEEELNITEIE